MADFLSCMSTDDRIFSSDNKTYKRNRKTPYWFNTKNGEETQRKPRQCRSKEVQKAFEIFQRGPCQLKSHAFILFMILYAAEDLTLFLLRCATNILSIRTKFSLERTSWNSTTGQVKAEPTKLSWNFTTFKLFLSEKWTDGLSYETLGNIS